MRPVAFGEALPARTRLTLFADDKPDRFLHRRLNSGWMKPWALHSRLRPGVPTYQVEDEEGRTHLPIEEEDEDRWCSLVAGLRWP
jgi:hypothetical protein